MGKHRHLFWLALPLLVFVVASGAAIYAFAVYGKAKAILDDIAALKVGSSSIDEVKALAARHRRNIKQMNCDASKCFVAFEVDNTWLHRLRLEPIAMFSASLEVNCGTLSHISIMLARDTRVFPTSPSAGMTDEYLQTPRWIRDLSTVYWFPTPVGKPYLWIGLTPQASAVQREHAYAYSLKCLIKPGGGCNLPCDYLPLAWHDWQAELEKQGFGDEGFGDYYPDRKRCK